MVFCNEYGVYEPLDLDGHNPYFSRWFSAIKNSDFTIFNGERHNPYFSRWFSAIKI